MKNPKIKLSTKYFLAGITLGIAALATTIVAVNIDSEFVSGERLTASAMNELKDALVALPNWEKGDDENDAVYTEGNVGIGTTTPTVELEVNGTVKATAFIGDFPGSDGFTESYSTGDQYFSLDTLHQYPHGLSGPPSIAIFELVCIQANNGYEIGDRVPFDNFAAANSGIRTAGYNDTHVFYRLGDNGYGSKLGPKTGNPMISKPLPSQWKVNVNAWRYQ